MKIARDSGAFLRENIEAFAVAIAMALVIRHFCVEAFRIPSNSMRPSLCGEHIGSDGTPRQGDRILVDKFAWMVRDPRRFEVAVFLFPLNVNRNFIKRIAGLPGEWLRVVDGDLWTSRDEGKSWEIARKPAGVRDELFFPYYPEPIDHPRAFDSLANRGWDPGPGWKVSGQEFTVDAGDSETALTFQPRVLPYDSYDTDRRSSPPYVGDVRLSFRLHVTRAGKLIARILEHGVAHELVLGADESHVNAGGPGGGKTPLDARLAAGKDHEISFANIDDELVVVIDGEEKIIDCAAHDGRLPATPPADLRVEGSEWWRHEISLNAAGLAGSISRVHIDRDIRYEGGEEPYKIPPGCYFMLGDNVGNSSDSRVWSIVEVELKGGTVFRFAPGSTSDGVNNPPSSRPLGIRGNRMVVEEDTEGLVRRFDVGDIVRWESGLPAHFVPRENLIGRAYAVFWPIYSAGVYRGPTRVKLIR